MKKLVSFSGSRRSSHSSSAGFLGCVRLLSNAIERLKDTGYQRLDLVADNNNPLPVKGQIVISLLSRDGHGTGGFIGYIIILTTPINKWRNRNFLCIFYSGSLNAVVDTLGNLSCSSPSNSATPGNIHASNQQPDEDLLSLLPEGWEERRTSSGRNYFVNHVTRTTQWDRPTRPANENLNGGGVSSAHRNPGANCKPLFFLLQVRRQQLNLVFFYPVKLSPPRTAIGEAMPTFAAILRALLALTALPVARDVPTPHPAELLSTGKAGTATTTTTLRM